MESGELIGALFVRIGSDLTDLHAGIGPGGKADRELESFTSRVNAGLGNMLKFGAALAGIGLIAVAMGSASPLSRRPTSNRLCALFKRRRARRRLK